MKKSYWVFLALLVIAVGLTAIFYNKISEFGDDINNFAKQKVVEPKTLITESALKNWKNLSPILAWSQDGTKAAFRFDAENIPLHTLHIFNFKTGDKEMWALKTFDTPENLSQIVGHFVDAAYTVDEANKKLNELGLTDTTENKVGATYAYKNITYQVEPPNFNHSQSVRFYFQKKIDDKRQAVTLYLANKNKDFDLLNRGQTEVYASPADQYLIAIARDLHPEFGLRQMVWSDSVEHIFGQKPFLIK